MMSATLDLVTHDDARPTSSAVHLKGHTALTYGELAESVGGSRADDDHPPRIMARKLSAPLPRVSR